MMDNSANDENIPNYALSFRNANSITLRKKEKNGSKLTKMLTLTDVIECGICKKILYNATSIYPCLHSFCAGCISKKCLQNPKCPTCSKPSFELMINSELRELVNRFLEQNPVRARTEEETVELDENEMRYLEEQIKSTKTSEEFAQRFSSGVRVFMRNDIQKYKTEKDKEIFARFVKLKGEHMYRNRVDSPMHINDTFECLRLRNRPVSESRTPHFTKNQTVINDLPSQSQSPPIPPTPKVIPALQAPLSPRTQPPVKQLQVRQQVASGSNPERIDYLTTSSVCNSLADEDIKPVVATISTPTVVGNQSASTPLVPARETNPNPKRRRKPKTKNDEEPFVPRQSARLAKKRTDKAARN